MAKRGRPTKLTDEVKDRFLQALRLGATYEIACGYAGITYQTYLNWKERAAKANSGIFFEFFEDIARAEGEAAVKWLALVEKHATEDPKWAAWKLERRYPHEYGKTVQRQEHTGKDGGPIQIEDWRSRAIEDIRAGRIAYEALAEAFNDRDLATELFREAGVPISTG